MGEIPRLPDCTHDGECEVRVIAISVSKDIEELRGRVGAVEGQCHELHDMLTAIDPPGLAVQFSGLMGKFRGAAQVIGVTVVVLMAFLAYMCNQQLDTNRNIQDLNKTMMRLIENLKSQGVISHDNPNDVASKDTSQSATE